MNFSTEATENSVAETASTIATETPSLSVEDLGTFSSTHSDQSIDQHYNYN